MTQLLFAYCNFVNAPKCVKYIGYYQTAQMWAFKMKRALDVSSYVGV